MTSITNKSKDNATINKTAKDGTVTIEVVGSKKQTVRPIMTVEARDVLDKIHADVNGKTRSESIEWFWIRHINLLSQRDFNSSYEHTLLRRISHSEDRKDKAKKEARQWKLIVTAVCIALIATMMITAS